MLGAQSKSYMHRACVHALTISTEYNIPYFEDTTFRIVDEEALASESTIRKLRPKNKEYYTRHQNEAFNNCYIIQR